jgi:hypothetical protein
LPHSPTAPAQCTTASTSRHRSRTRSAIIQITLDKLGAAPHQVLDTLGPPPVDPHVQALLQGEARKAPADEAACAGDQNLHVLPRVLYIFHRGCLDARRQSNGTNHWPHARARWSVNKFEQLPAAAPMMPVQRHIDRLIWQ